jgi:hypothetical protein
MRVEVWEPEKYNVELQQVAMDRLEAAALRLAMETRRTLRSRIGSGRTTGISRPVYKTGPYAGQPWTARDFGELLNSVRVTRLRTSGGKAFSRKLNIRVYVGHYRAYYARIFEYSKPYLRPAVASTLAEIKTILGATS